MIQAASQPPHLIGLTFLTPQLQDGGVARERDMIRDFSVTPSRAASRVSELKWWMPNDSFTGTTSECFASNILHRQVEEQVLVCGLLLISWVPQCWHSFVANIKVPPFWVW
jgi:hypothetical protein